MSETGTLHAVVVDDEPAVCSAMGRALKGLGCVVHSFNSGEEVLTWLRIGNRPGLIITDTRMPNMSGPEWLTIARREALFENAYVVIMSGADADIAKQAIREGLARMFLSKPWKAITLREIVNSLKYSR